MADFTVHQYGLDVYGRPVYMTAFMEAWYEGYCDELGWRPRILQGCYMERLGGGAAASDGAHDKAKCLDLETAGHSSADIDRMVKVARTRGGGAYRRDRTPRHGGMTPHMHVTVGADADGSPMADILWSSYTSGGDGLGAGSGRAGDLPDYEWRPSPLVLTPPEDDMTEDQVNEIIEKYLAKAGALDEVKVDVGGKARKRLSAAFKDLYARTKA